MTKTRPFLSTCYGYPSTTEVPPCCQAATKKLTFSTTSVLLLLNVPLSLSRGTVFRRQKNPRRGYRPKIAGILFVCNEPEGKYYTVPCCCCVMLVSVRCPLSSAMLMVPGQFSRNVTVVYTVYVYRTECDGSNTDTKTCQD